jgi:L-asparaginase / beta-aspartyl-peptidase
MTPKIIVHGGAWDIPKSLHRPHLTGIKSALKIGQKVLLNTDDSVQTVLAIIKNLEDNPVFDAGKGSFLNNAAEVEMDAGIMVGTDLSVGAVAAIQNVKNPIEVANLVRIKTQHILLVGEGASGFAREQDVEFIKTEDMLIGREKNLYKKLAGQDKVNIKSFFETKKPSDTVGAVVINSRGEIVAGTSTGGTPYKLAGRVGDCPIVGAGFYADDSVAGVVCTGWGEGILKVQLAREAIERIKAGQNPNDAVLGSVAYMYHKINGDGGIIIIDKNGETGFAFNTPFMPVGHATGDSIEFIHLGKM